VPAVVDPGPRPFDAVAARYDAEFTRTRLGRWLRAAVWEFLGASFAAGQRVLEVGCGTGEDAVWLASRGVRVVATDAAPGMLEVARRKAEAAGVAERVRIEPLDLTEPDALRWGSGAFDGAFSSFGALNCVARRRPVAAVLARWVRPGGRVVLVVMGPLCPWEMAWHLLHGEMRTAFRRFHAGAPVRVGDGPTVRIWYPSPRRLRTEFSPHFRLLETSGIGVVLPTSALCGVVERRPRLFAVLARLEARVARRFPAPWMSDHCLLVLERV